MNVSIIGCGAYGLALGSILYKNKCNIKYWTFDKNEKEFLEKNRESNKLKDFIIPNDVNFSCNMKEVIENSVLIIIAVPAFAFDNVSIEISKYLKKNQHVLIATKGIEQDTCMFLNEVFKKYNDSENLAVISGPTFAVEMVKDIPIGLSLAVNNFETERIVKAAFENDKTKLRTTNDIIGVEICGSIKNVMAIASGILGGMKVPDSTKALFLTESLNDVKELIEELGGDKKTILSFAGFGDILMTCSSTNSRNYSFGELIGQGKSKKEIDIYLENTTVEGAYTLKSIHKLIKDRNIYLPIIDLIYDIVFNDKPKEEMLTFLIKK